MKQVNYAKESKGSVKIKPSIKIVLDYILNSFTIAEIEIRKLKHDPTELLTRAVQPVLWLLIFGQAFSRIRAIPTGNVNYQTFMAPGILAQSMMFISIFYGLSIIWDKDQGILQKLIAMPVPRAAFVTGKAFGAGVRAISQVIIILFLAFLLRLDIKWSILNVIMSILTIVLGAAFFFFFVNGFSSHSKKQRKIYGNRTGYNDAIVFCQQCNLSNTNNATLASNSSKNQSVKLCC